MTADPAAIFPQASAANLASNQPLMLPVVFDPFQMVVDLAYLKEKNDYKDEGEGGHVWFFTKTSKPGPIEVRLKWIGDPSIGFIITSSSPIVMVITRQTIYRLCPLHYGY
jgi:hypothetical protein